MIKTLRKHDIKVLLYFKKYNLTHLFPGQRLKFFLYKWQVLNVLYATIFKIHESDLEIFMCGILKKFTLSLIKLTFNKYNLFSISYTL